jgi:hypothetical protein
MYGNHEMDRLLSESEAQLLITIRRLEKSGPSHFARSRFDAVRFIVRNLSADTSSDISPTLKERLIAFDSTLQKLCAAYPELDPVANERNPRSRNRTEMLIDSIMEAAGLRRRGSAMDAPLYENIPPIEPRAELVDPNDEADSAIRLSGMF